MIFYKLENYQRALFANILERYMIFKNIKKEFAEIIFDYNKYGKPFLIGEPNVHFNISHSGDWVVAAIHSFPRSRLLRDVIKRKIRQVIYLADR